MKKSIHLATRALLLAGALWLGSCQEEFENVNISGSDSATLTTTSEAVVLLANAASFDGSFDNIVDGASCFALKFPYTVIANGNEIDVSSRDDLQVIEYYFDLAFEEPNELAIVFPVTITRANYSEVEVNSTEELAELAGQCVEGGQDDDIECLDFVYPITLYTFDRFKTQTGSFSVGSDEQLYLFLRELDEDDVVSIEYPLSLSEKGGTDTREVNSNEELAAALRSARESCDEDDDNDYNDDDLNSFPEGLDALLMQCSWQVHSIERDGVDLSSYYGEYVFYFNGGDTAGSGPEPSLQVKNGWEGPIDGDWAVSRNDRGETILALGLEGLPPFNGDWSVFEVTYDTGVWDFIVLYAGQGNRVVLRNRCYGISGFAPEVLTEMLRECSWVIGGNFNHGQEGHSLLGYELEFLAGGEVTLSNGATTVSTGTWEEITYSGGRNVLGITMNEEPALSSSWLMVFREDYQLLFDTPGATDNLQLLRECVQNGSTPDESDYLEAVRTTLMNGDWHVASYTEGDTDLTGGFAGFGFRFGTGNALSVSSDTGEEKEGLWRVMVNASDFIYRDVYLNLGTGDDLISGLTDVWTLNDIGNGSFTENRIELYHYNIDLTRIVLVLEK